MKISKYRRYYRSRKMTISLFLHVYAFTTLAAQLVKNLPALQETWVQSLDQEDPLEK